MFYWILRIINKNIFENILKKLKTKLLKITKEKAK